jgi:drug/metabolite transporter (DMT)-like permease
MNFISGSVLIVSVLAIAIADVCIKKAGVSISSFKEVFSNPWFLVAIGLYILQVVGFAYLFFSGFKLTVVGIVQTALYALVIILSGVLIFGESVSLIQGIGIALAILGVVLINF